MKKVSGLFNFIVLGVFNAMMLFIMSVLLFIDKKIDYNRKIDLKTSNFIYLIAGIIIFTIILLGVNYITKKIIGKLTKKQCRVLMTIVFAVFFIVQCILAYNMYFPTRWDAEILRESSNILADGSKMGSEFAFQYYFTSCSNNVFLVVLFSIVKGIFLPLGLNVGEAALVVISIICIDVGGAFAVLTVQNITGKRDMSVLAFIVFVLLVGISPWMIVPYSDTYSLFFTNGILYLYTHIKKIDKEERKISNLKRMIIWGIIFFLGILGFYIKPTIVIALMAVCFAEIWQFLFAPLKVKIGRLKVLPVILLFVLLAVLIHKGSYKYIGFERDMNREFPMTHYLMVGNNTVNDGTYFRDDVTRTSNEHTYEDKMKVNLQTVKERLKEMGLKGYIVFQSRKTLVNYNDGTFAWSKEGGFYDYMGEPKNDGLAKWLRTVIVVDGKHYRDYACVEQIIWITVLALMFLINFRKWGNYSGPELVNFMSIIGITLFLALFEARARYLFLYSTFYVVGAIIGLNALIDRLESKRGK